jgi:hypothetical protein
VAILRLATTARNAAADAVVDLLDVGTTNAAGKLEIRAGTLPADPQTAPAAGDTLLATVVLAAPAAGAAASGAATITDPASVTAAATGTATWARFYNRDNAAVFDCDVTATGGGGAITLSTTSISSGVTVDLGAITYTQPQG